MQSDFGVHKKFTNDNQEKTEPPKQFRPNSFSVLVGVHQIMQHDLFCPVVDIVHIPHPGYGVGPFQRLGYALPFGDLGDEIFHLLIAGCVDFIEMLVQFLGKDKPLVYGRAVLFQISFVLSAIHSDVIFGRVRQGNVRVIVIPDFCVGQS